MATTNNPLLTQASWILSKLPAYLQNAPAISDDPNHLSPLNTTRTAKLNGFITKAIIEMAKGPNSGIFVTNIGGMMYASEYKDENGVFTLASANSANGEVLAAIKNGESYQSVPTTDFDTTSILAMYLEMLANCENATVAAAVRGLLDQAKEEHRKNAEIPLDILYLLNDYVQQALSQGIVKCDIPYGGINNLSKARVVNGAFANGTVVCGSSEVLSPGASSTVVGTVITVAEAKRKFAAYAATRTWTPEQEDRIREFPDDYLVPEEIVEMADWFLASRGSKLPANNMCWRGVTGCGKSTGAALLSCILHTPLYIMTCYTNMETNDFLSTLVPTSRPSVTVNLPTFEDILMDPEYAYEQLTGMRVDGVTNQTVLEKYGEACAANAGKSSTYYKRVKSEYITALEIGAIVEIQEFSRIRDSGVLVGLNEHDHAGAVIPLIDGSYIRRHENAITLWTDNVGYGSCRPVDPSVMRRMTFVVDTFELEKDKVVNRALYNTDNALKKNIVEAMYEVWKAIRDYCIREDVTDGDLSPSDLENWISRVAKVGLTQAMDTCRKCLIAKTTTDRETQDRITTTAAQTAIDKWLGKFM